MVLGLSYAIEIKPVGWAVCPGLSLNCGHVIAEVYLWVRETVIRCITWESVTLLNCPSPSTDVTIIDPSTTSNYRGANSGWVLGSVLCVATKPSPQMLVVGGWRGGAGSGEKAERGALRAGMWLLVVRESEVRTGNERQAGQQDRHLHLVRQAQVIHRIEKRNMDRNAAGEMVCTESMPGQPPPFKTTHKPGKKKTR